MKRNIELIHNNTIKNKIHSIRDMQVILDEDLAELYGVKTKRLNEQVKRNIGRFPQEFMFQLTENELNSLRSQFATAKNSAKRRFLPYAFTEQGVAMLSGVLKSTTAVRVSISIMNAFVTMRKFIAANAEIFHRLDKVEIKQLENDEKFNQIFDAIQTREIKPDKGIFYDGQVFDAYKFVSDLIKSAEKSIILIDNYIDESILLLFTKKRKNVSVSIFTKNISEQLKLDLEKYNSQYPQINIQKFKKSHDRFLIIDDKIIYHFGASLKDLGRKWFAFSKFEKETIHMIERLN